MSNRARERAWQKKTKGMTGKAIEALISGVLLGKRVLKFGGKAEKKKCVPVKVMAVLGITPGGNHAWVRSNVGVIRKPLGTFKLEAFRRAQGERIL